MTIIGRTQQIFSATYTKNKSAERPTAEVLPLVFSLVLPLNRARFRTRATALGKSVNNKITINVITVHYASFSTFFPLCFWKRCLLFYGPML